MTKSRKTKTAKPPVAKPVEQSASLAIAWPTYRPTDKAPIVTAQWPTYSASK